MNMPVRIERLKIMHLHWKPSPGGMAYFRKHQSLTVGRGDDKSISINDAPPAISRVLFLKYAIPPGL
jgi:hypothetical protein